MLNSGAFVNWDVVINGVTVDNFTVDEGFVGTVNRSQSFGAIAGPDYTVEMLVTNEVAPGQGSHTFRYALGGFHQIELLGDDCALTVDLASRRVGAGETLGVSIEVVHRGRRAVTVPFHVWIEAPDGSMVAMRQLRQTTLHPGETVTRQLGMQVPPDLPAGRYWLRVGLDRMKQGSAVTGRPFEVR